MSRLASVQGPNGIQLFSDGGQLFMVPSAGGTKYDCYVFDLVNNSTNAPNLNNGASDSGWTHAVPISVAAGAVQTSPWAVFCVAQETPVAGKPCPILIQGPTKLNVTVNSAVARGTSLSVDDTANDVRDGGDGREVALSTATLAASGVHDVYFDGLTYRG